MCKGALQCTNRRVWKTNFQSKCHNPSVVFHSNLRTRSRAIGSFYRKKKGNDIHCPQQGHVLFKEEAAIKTPQGRLTDTALGIVHQTLTKRQPDTSEMTEIKLENTSVQSAHSYSRNSFGNGPVTLTVEFLSGGKMQKQCILKQPLLQKYSSKVLKCGGTHFTDVAPVVARVHKGRKSS